jgi:hypothetical protein
VRITLASPTKREWHPLKCGKCGSHGNKIDVRPNWKEQPVMPTKLRYE